MAVAYVVVCAQTLFLMLMWSLFVAFAVAAVAVVIVITFFIYVFILLVYAVSYVAAVGVAATGGVFCLLYLTPTTLLLVSLPFPATSVATIASDAQQKERLCLRLLVRSSTRAASPREHGLILCCLSPAFELILCCLSNAILFLTCSYCSGTVG